MNRNVTESMKWLMPDKFSAAQAHPDTPKPPPKMA